MAYVLMVNSHNSTRSLRLGSSIQWFVIVLHEEPAAISLTIEDSTEITVAVPHIQAARMGPYW